MSRLSRLSRPAWLTTGLLIGAILVPTAAFAAATVVNISGGGHTASVSAAGQLRTIEMDPANFVHGRAIAGSCQPLAVAPANRALVIKQININAEAVSGANAYAYLMTSPICSGTILSEVALSAHELTSVPLGTGIPVRAGAGLYITTDGAGTSLEANAFGYSLTPSAVPASITARQQIGMTPKALAEAKRR